jgi:hypothetical protein
MPKIFAITVNHIEISKKHVFDSLEKYCSHLVVAEEKHFLNDGIHHHIYLRAIQDTSTDRVKVLLNRIYGLNPRDEGYSNKLSVDNCRSEKSWLIYITKQDADPSFKGISLSQLSFYCKALHWASNTEEFSVADPFILNHPQYYKLLELVHARVRTTMMSDHFEKIRPLSIVFNENQCEMNWQKEVIDWWNDWAINGWKHKKRQLYLFGPSNTGKTTFIHRLLNSCLNPSSKQNDDEEYFYERQVFRPLPNEPKYSMQGYEKKLHNIILIDEFDITEYNCSDLKKILAGESIMSNTKNGSGRTIYHRNPTILISNLEPPSDTVSNQYRGFQERLLCIKADRMIME